MKRILLFVLTNVMVVAVLGPKASHPHDNTIVTKKNKKMV
jgi:hypothetical protein